MSEKYYVIEIRDGLYIQKSNLNGRGEKSVMLTDNIFNADRYVEETVPQAVRVANLSYGRLRVLEIKYDLGAYR